jgi:hypothetical protein
LERSDSIDVLALCWLRARVQAGHNTLHSKSVCMVVRSRTVITVILHQPTSCSSQRGRCGSPRKIWEHKKVSCMDLCRDSITVCVSAGFLMPLREFHKIRCSFSVLCNRPKSQHVWGGFRARCRPPGNGWSAHAATRRSFSYSVNIWAAVREACRRARVCGCVSV